MAGAAGPPRRAGRLLGRFGLTRQVTCCGHRLTRGQSEPGSWTQSPSGLSPSSVPQPSHQVLRQNEGLWAGEGRQVGRRWVPCLWAGHGLSRPPHRSGWPQDRKEDPKRGLTCRHAEPLLLPGDARPGEARGLAGQQHLLLSHCPDHTGQWLHHGGGCKGTGWQRSLGTPPTGGVSEHQRQRLLKGTGASGNLGTEDIGRLSLFSQRIP